MKLLKTLENRSLYYFVSLFMAIVYWLLLTLIDLDFVNIVFFLLAYIWNFSLLVPGALEYAFKSKSKLSLYVIAIKFNYYLSLFTKKYEFKFHNSIVRSISPALFTLLLLLIGGSGNVLFALLGSLIFEVTNLFIIERVTKYKSNLKID